MTQHNIMLIFRVCPLSSNKTTLNIKQQLTQYVNFQGKPLRQATEQQLNGEKRNAGYLSACGCGVNVYSV